MMHSLLITRPDDWHVHLRDAEVLEHTVLASAKHFSRALVMPNLKPALTTLPALTAYRKRIMTALNHRFDFTPYMTFYLNESVDPHDLEQIKPHDYILGAKFYPAGATTHSEAGARSIHTLYPLLEVMQSNDLVLQIHGEVTHGDIFEREARFIEEFLEPLIRDFPKLRMVLEHISTKAAVEFVKEAPLNVGATITPHHLLYNRNQLLSQGIKPHYYCLPILKHERDQKAIQEAAMSGNPKFFAGTDSAPHSKKSKESACGCAGIYSSPYALAMYAQVFDHQGKLSMLDDFMGRFGADFYHLPRSKTFISLVKKPQTIPKTLPFGRDKVVPIAAESVLEWSVDDSQ